MPKTTSANDNPKDEYEWSDKNFTWNFETGDSYTAMNIRYLGQDKWTVLIVSDQGPIYGKPNAFDSDSEAEQWIIDYVRIEVCNTGDKTLFIGEPIKLLPLEP